MNRLTNELRELDIDSASLHGPFDDIARQRIETALMEALGIEGLHFTVQSIPRKQMFRLGMTPTPGAMNET